MSGWADNVLPRDSSALLAGERLHSRGVLVCAALSLVCHAAIGLAFNAWGVRETGFLATPTDAVSVELFASDVMEQVAMPEASANASAAAAVAPQQGSASESAATAQAAPEPERVARNDPAPTPAEQTPSETTDDVALPETAEASDIPLPARTIVPEQNEARKQETPAEDKSKPKRDERPRPQAKKAEKTADDAKTTRSTKQGGAQSRGQASSASAPGRVSASAGDISGYAARVRARVAANRPPGRGMRGTSVVSFGVSKGGGLTYARVARSSGNASLDQAAVSAVRRAAPFPPPPAGATSGQLRFSTSFHFR